MAFVQALSFKYLFPNVKNGVHWKPTTASGGVNNGFFWFGVQHFYAHINHVARRKILPFFAFTAFVYQVFKGFIYYVKV